MTKTELMENYTAEQLAEMVVKLNSAMDSLKYSDSFLKSGLFDNPAVAACEARINILQNKINNLEEDNGRLQSKLDTYNNRLLQRCTKEAKEMIDHNHFDGVRIVTWEQWNNRGEKSMNISDIQKCQDEYEKLLKESPIHGTIEKICKDILGQKNNDMAMEFTRIICDLLKRYGVYVHCTETKFGEKITANSIEEQYGIVFDSMDFSQHDKEFTDKIKELKEELEKSNKERAKILWEFCDSVKKEDYEKEVNHLQSEVEKYRKAFEDAKKERDCQISEYQKKIEELKGKLEIQTAATKYTEEYVDSLKNEITRSKTTITQIDEILSEFFGVTHDTAKPNEFKEILRKKIDNITCLPNEAIKAADFIIDAWKKSCNRRYFERSDLKQIAEYLMVYYNYDKAIGI